MGTVGYDHADWQGGFYDAELPPDWRFLHYCNQFRALLLPVADAATWVAGRLDELVADGDDAFRVFVEIDDELLEHTRLEPALDSLGSRLEGVIYRAGRSLRGDRTTHALRRLSDARGLCIDGGDADTESVRELANRLEVATVWRPPVEPLRAACGTVLVARVGDVALVELRRVLETLSAPPYAHLRRGVFLDDVRRAPELARQCRIMAELMGV